MSAKRLERTQERMCTRQEGLRAYVICPLVPGEVPTLSLLPLEIGGPTNVSSRRDITFMHTIACLTLSRHPPRDGLVREMDFRTSPPTRTLQSVYNPAHDYAKIVLGEKEIKKFVLRRRALTYMSGLGPEEVGIVYSRRFLPKGSQAVLTFVNWEMLNGHGVRYERRG